MNRYINLFIIGVVLFSFTGCSSKEERLETDAYRFKSEYEELNNEENKNNGNKYRSLEIDEDNPFIYKDASDIIEMINNNETFVVYFGFDSCPWCRSIISPLIEVTKDLGIDVVYYVDVKEIRDTMVIDENGEVITKVKGTDEYYKLLDLMDLVLEDYILINEEGEEIDTGKKRIYAPNIVSVVDGDVIQLTDGISDNQTDGYMDLTEEIKKESYDKIKCSIECVIKNKNTCSAKTKC